MYKLKQIQQELESKFGNVNSIKDTVREAEENIHFLSVVSFIDNITNLIEKADFKEYLPTIRINISYDSEYDNYVGHWLNIHLHNEFGESPPSSFVNQRKSEMNQLTLIGYSASDNINLNLTSCYDPSIKPVNIELKLGSCKKSNQLILINSLLSPKLKIKLEKEQLTLDLDHPTSKRKIGTKV